MMPRASGRIVWLTSYPKSGNTWMRAMLTALLQASETPPDLNNLIGATEFTERQFLDDLCGVNSADLPRDRLQSYIRAMRMTSSGLVSEPTFVKVHDRFDTTSDGLALFPAEASRAAVCIVRHPFDVAVSLAAHNSSDLDSAIELMGDSSYSMHSAKGRGSEFLPVAIGTWSGHVLSWLDQTEVPLLLVRYEDMLGNPAKELGKVAGIAGIKADQSALKAAAESCSFGHLRDAEEREGFSEKPDGINRFFRSGRSGTGSERLTDDQRAAVLRIAQQTMERLGYDP
jgi:hypothetical protein